MKDLTGQRRAGGFQRREQHGNAKLHASTLPGIVQISSAYSLGFDLAAFRGNKDCVGLLQHPMCGGPAFLVLTILRIPLSIGQGIVPFDFL